MSLRPTTTQPTGSVGPMVTTRAPFSLYADFYLASMWEWTPQGVIRVTSFLESLNVDRPTYRFMPGLNMWQVRCAKKYKNYVLRNFSQLLEKIEDEFVEALGENDLQLALLGRNAQNDVLHPDVMIPIALPRVHMPPRNNAISRSDTASSVGTELGQNDVGGLVHSRRPVVSLTVPEELRDVATIVVWQDLQAKDKNFEGTTFVSPGALARLEAIYGVQIVTDIAQKVIFIGKDGPNKDDALQVKNKLTNLLHNFQAMHKPPQVSHHVYFIESATPYTIDTREISCLNPVLARSTIIDPWKYPVPEQYEAFQEHGQFTGVFALRACLLERFKNGERNKFWSVLGPYAQNVFNGRRATRSSAFFKGARASPRTRIAAKLVGPGPVSTWLDAVSCVPGDAVPAVEIALTATPLHDGDEDAPIPLNFDPSNKREVAAIRAPGPSPLPGMMAQPQLGSLLDRQDAILRDPRSTMQRAMKPSLRKISVADPETLVVGVPSASPDQPTPTGAIVSKTSDQELDIFVVSVGRLLHAMRGRYGVVSLRADIGRFYICNLPTSAHAMNKEDRPASGWLPTELRQRLELHDDFLFTKPLSSWGNDADFLAAGEAWKPWCRAVFFDFSFQVMWGSAPLDMVLEVNAEDYTWKMRFLNNTIDVVNVHCLARHWDFQAHLTSDPVIECVHNWGSFAEALVNSLEVTPPTLEFQHTFTDAPAASPECPIIVHDVRARQVCRFRHQSEKTYLDITRILPTQVRTSDNPAYRKVIGVLAKCTPHDPYAGDNRNSGEFAQFFEASVSSVRLEELLKQNRALIPGDQADWTVQQIEKEGLLADMYKQAAELVKSIDGVGVECDNGNDLRQRTENTVGLYLW